MSYNLRIRLIGDDYCADCWRPPNAANVHNDGCRASPRRHCTICGAIHDRGDDCHRRPDGLYCTEEVAVAVKIQECPAFTEDRCRDEVRKTFATARTDRTAIEWWRAQPPEAQKMIEVIAASIAGAWPGGG